MLLKALLLLLAIAFGLWLWRAGARPSGTRRRAPEKASERMVQCAQCGVHLPESESVAADGRAFCCDDHRQRYHQ